MTCGKLATWLRSYGLPRPPLAADGNPIVLFLARSTKSTRPPLLLAPFIPQSKHICIYYYLYIFFFNRQIFEPTWCVSLAYWFFWIHEGTTCAQRTINKIYYMPVVCRIRAELRSWTRPNDKEQQFDQSAIGAVESWLRRLLGSTEKLAQSGLVFAQSRSGSSQDLLDLDDTETET